MPLVRFLSSADLLVFQRTDESNLSFIGEGAGRRKRRKCWLRALLDDNDDDDVVGLRSLCALGIYGMDDLRERIGYKEIPVQAPSSSSNRSLGSLTCPV